MSTLVQLEARVAARLADAGGALWALSIIDEALRSALSDYSTALPRAVETVITLPGVGREIALNNLTNLVAVLDVWWPFDTLTEKWPPNQVAGFRVWWDDSQPVLLLASKSGNQPQLNDSLRIWYTTPHLIANLDGGSITSVFPNHESALVTGAAGYAANMALVNQMSSVQVEVGQVPALHQWAAQRLADWHTFLAAIAANSPSFGPPYGDGWGIDKWDANRNPRATQGGYPNW
jgi:hypothetical protein